MNTSNVMVSTPYPMALPQQKNPLSYSPIARSQNLWSQQTPQFKLQQPQDINYSPKHTGLYLYLVRLLRPIWKKKCVIMPQCNSSISYQDCSEILDDLYALKGFLDSLPLNNLSGE